MWQNWRFFKTGCRQILFQLIKRSDYRLGYQVKASMIFYQDSRYRDFLFWLKKKLRYGYVRDRNDHISEYNIVGFRAVGKIIKILYPYLILKKDQANLALSILENFPANGRVYSAKMLLSLAEEVDKFSELNYSKKRTNTSKSVHRFLLENKLLSP